MTELDKPETPETFAAAIAKLRTFGAFPDQARIDAVVAAHEREVAEFCETLKDAIHHFSVLSDDMLNLHAFECALRCSLAISHARAALEKTEGGKE